MASETSTEENQGLKEKREGDNNTITDSKNNKNNKRNLVTEFDIIVHEARKE